MWEPTGEAIPFRAPVCQKPEWAARFARRMDDGAQRYLRTGASWRTVFALSIVPIRRIHNTILDRTAGLA
jgi:hypothetical protein